MASNCTDYTWGRNCKKNGGREHRCSLTAEHVLHLCKCGWKRR